MNPIRIIVADDHSIMRAGLRKLFGATPDLLVVAEAANGGRLLEVLDRTTADVLLLDISMPGPGGVELIRQLRAQRPQLPVLVLSMHAEGQIVTRALRAGAAGYATKDCDPEDLLAAVRKAARGGHFIDPALVESVIRFNAAAEQAPNPCAELSERERQVLERMAAGQSVGGIAGELRLSPKTVSTHKARLMQKLDLRSTAELMKFAIRHGLTSQ